LENFGGETPQAVLERAGAYRRSFQRPKYWQEACEAGYIY
jgi:hypothetical protein